MTRAWRRLIPMPLASTALLGFWLLLNQSLSLGHVLLGILVGLIGGWAAAALDMPRSWPRRPRAAAILFAYVVTDIVRSNIAVAAIIISGRTRGETSGFVEIPLDMRNPYGLATLATIITSTPGTLWVDHNESTGTLTIHVLDLVDKAEWVRTIKDRYECMLMELLE